MKNDENFIRSKEFGFIENLIFCVQKIRPQTRTIKQGEEKFNCCFTLLQIQIENICSKWENMQNLPGAEEFSL